VILIISILAMGFDALANSRGRSIVNSVKEIIRPRKLIIYDN
jgi:hypothetical protein